LAKKTSIRLKTLTARPANAYGVLDSTPRSFVDINKAQKDELVKALRISPKIAQSIISWRSKKPITDTSELRLIKGLSTRVIENIRANYITGADSSLGIANVSIEDGHVYGDKPFKLRIQFFNSSESPVAFVVAQTSWMGEPFEVEQLVEDSTTGIAVIEFDSERTLPVGQAEFNIAIYREDGARADFRKTFFVLPSNPLSLSLSPAGATVTGTWSARGAYQRSSDTFLTECDVTIANGDSNSVSIDRRTEWKFWDGGINGTLIESGFFTWPSSINISGNSIWKGRVSFSSPSGSGIYNKYQGKEDLTVEILMNARNGRRISGSLTCRVMMAYGVNIIKVGNFGSQEGVDLYDAVDITRQIYERRDITFSEVRRWIIDDAHAGGFTILNDDPEFRDLLTSWSVPNDNIDVYLCQDFSWSTYNGMAGDIPGPSSKGGDKDGVATDKTGYADALGRRRLDTDILSKLIGHEVGHYLGLEHVDDANNLMLRNTGVRGPDMTYDQYRKMLPHGYIRVS
jgi:hypothetical protein